jgi:hypothetical protein
VALVLRCPVIKRTRQIRLTFKMWIALGLLSLQTWCNSSLLKVRLTIHKLFSNWLRMLTHHNLPKQPLIHKEALPNRISSPQGLITSA